METGGFETLQSPGYHKVRTTRQRGEHWMFIRLFHDSIPTMQVMILAKNEKEKRTCRVQ